MDKENKILIIFILFLSGINIFVWTYVPRAPSHLMTVSFLDVGQGDSIFIEAPNGKQLLIDGGRNSLVTQELSSQMSFQDKEIDVVLATHPDSDHIGGLPDIFDRLKILNYIDNGAKGDTNTYRALMEKVSLSGSKYLKATRGMVIVLDKKNQVYFQVLAPDENFNFKDTNDYSIVGRLVYGESSFLLTGDASKAVENILVYSDGEILDSDILKAGHHGSKTSSGLLFLEAVTPDSSIISAGYNNTYGHPHINVLNNLEKVGGEILETSKEGTITFESDGVDIWRK
ncbi:MAG: competence protein ComEC [Patescibacteria group bacterium]|nr:competence protein ComEC [Patescibacteria group bacterium]